MDDEGIQPIFSEIPSSIESGNPKGCWVGDTSHRHLAESTIMATLCDPRQRDQDFPRKLKVKMAKTSPFFSSDIAGLLCLSTEAREHDESDKCQQALFH